MQLNSHEAFAGSAFGDEKRVREKVQDQERGV